MKNTKHHAKYWAERKINWEQDYLKGVIDHPHRQLIIDALAKLQWRSVLEVGMGAGANLVRIKQQWPNAEVGGIDINEDAVLTAQRVDMLHGAKFFRTDDVQDIFLSDGALDLILSDACLIYVSKQPQIIGWKWWKFIPYPIMDWSPIKSTLTEMKRVGRTTLLLCELHSEKKVWFSKYNIHNYRKLLEELDCFNIKIEKIPKEAWPGTPWEKYGHIISANYI